MKIGIVSDTHGLLRPEVLPLLSGVESILHLGDVGDAKILKALGKIAPITATTSALIRARKKFIVPVAVPTSWCSTAF